MNVVDGDIKQFQKIKKKLSNVFYVREYNTNTGMFYLDDAFKHNHHFSNPNPQT